MAFTKDDFKNKIEEIQKESWYKQPLGFGIARVDRGQLNKDKILQATFPVVNWKENYGSAAVFLNALKEAGIEVDTSKSEFVCSVSDAFLTSCIETFRPYIPEAKGQDHKNVQIVSKLASLPIDTGFTEDDYKVVFIFEDETVQSVEAAYLKLYALSSGKAALRSLNLNGIFGTLHNCAWVGNKPVELDWLRENEISLKLTGKYPEITMVDKFPRFLSHIIPADNVRILETSKVRFGAQLAGGTTVMPGAAYINFNAGTEGAVMVEGRISSSAKVGAGSDVGGGASILGVLSGTDGVPVTIGENTLLGANSCTGTAIGDGCILDAGVTILPGTKITLSEKAVEALKEINPGKEISTSMKGSDFQGVNGVHFRVNSTTGQTIAMRSTREVKLNADLH
ncbi:tetrahydrodipicolinate N-succinyltransferase N-terminal domain-containing protein [Halarcobacter anaerophilus]|jgi:2,3,4,5-tetrahydropyridine-2-carboxylate N-succinyltransferase|uniref:2,3,4,5-tetrahydropyridine-2,6-carboxylate N-succinyltransferase n=1 Tax=Halarcobacter anaerophilus TaxID=877500 RepID=A0A4Q0Y3V0_9BACT|nr:tetrahydrodipicolinate N-succinyltransferase N-terminal domain-containing protein [Halarcobacter anaerophilus]QDF28627.1 tetrahydrodipicolinate succinylase [Halarcobacter anaerophilus]RXJ63349.1 2,3,4,5-tetrahydropyridine-2,6-carboxylate N-succinyltransferase [Halarcobacter anaerophilus]